MTEKPKRDQRAYEVYNKYSTGVPAAKMMAAVDRYPYANKPCVGGVRGYPPKVMAVVVALCEHWNVGYRRTAATLRTNGDLRKKLGLTSVPSKGTIGNAYRRIPKPYLQALNGIITEDIQHRSVAGDSTGLSGSRKAVWLDVRTGDRKAKKGWMKLHTLIDIGTRVVLEMDVTKGTAGDCPTMTELLGKIKGGKGDGCFDSAYLSRNLCNMLESLGLTPFIKPKSNTTSNAKGSWAWKEMVTMYREDRKQFDERYHPRSIVEAVYAALKAMYGGSLRTRTPKTQTTEAVMHVLNYNIEMVARAQLNAGSLTEADIRAVAAC